MRTKRIFEIPIYPTSQEKFDKKWDTRNSKELNEWVNAGWVCEEAKKEIDRLAFPKTIWKYAQIIGYLTIDISENDIWFEVYAPLSKKGIRHDRKTKVFPQAWAMNGTHFHIDGTMSNEKIIAEIKEWVTNIQDEHLSKWHLDLTTFLNSIDYMDFRRLIMDI